MHRFSPPTGTTDLVYGSAVSMNNEGDTVAIAGSLNFNQGYVDVFKLDPILKTWSQLGQEIFTDIDEVIPTMDVSLSGDGSTLAFGVIYLLASSSTSGVTMFRLNNDGNSWHTLGSTLAVGSLGPSPGLKVSLSKDGNHLIVGERYYEENTGRVIVYELSDDSIDWDEIGVVTGTSQSDRMGASVDITSDADYCAVGLPGSDLGGIDSGSVIVYSLDDPNTSFGSDPSAQVGLTIHGESPNDASGFSVKVVKVLGTTILKVAIGAIFNHGDDGNMIHSGHVRVYVYDLDDDSTNTWTQEGNDMDGDFGVIWDRSEGSFHVGDSHGFSLAMSLHGDRVAMGSPFSSKKENREAEMYYGSVKLFHYNSNVNEWFQIAENIVGESPTSNSGWSIGLSGNGKVLLIGGPSDPQGNVLVWYQDETSDEPSLSPTASESPSVSPVALRVPSIAPSISSRPSLTPPLSITDTFKIQSNFKRFHHVANKSVGTTWCLEAQTLTGGSPLFIRPCEDNTFPLSHEKQLFYYDESTHMIKVRLAPELCIKDEGEMLALQQCNADSNDFFIDQRDHESSIISVTRANSGKELYLGVDLIRIFSRVRLYREEIVNDSWNSWEIVLEVSVVLV